MLCVFSFFLYFLLSLYDTIVFLKNKRKQAVNVRFIDRLPFKGIIV